MSESWHQRMSIREKTSKNFQKLFGSFFAAGRFSRPECPRRITPPAGNKCPKAYDLSGKRLRQIARQIAMKYFADKKKAVYLHYKNESRA
ncbi:MAG TPA: hypothetical protein DDZ04_06505 [Parabacteroides sp.]|nr:hypothetical protein [Parabacteroides sp.]